MLSTVTHHFRHNVVAYLALFLALGGTSYATWLAPANSVNSRAIIDGQVTTPDLAANAIRADEFCILGSCVGSKEIANNAVSSGELASGAVSTSKVAHHSITTDKLAVGAVGNGQLATDAVTGDKVKDGSLTGSDVAAKSLGSRQINEQSLAQGQAYSAYHDESVDIDSGTTAQVLNLSLPAGTYLVLGKAYGSLPYGGSLECTTSGGNTSDSAHIYYLSTNGPAGNMGLGSALTMTTVASGSAPFNVQLDCTTGATNGQYAWMQYGYITLAKLTAVSLASNQVSPQ